MAIPETLEAGKSSNSIQFGVIDNHINILINPDDENLPGWGKLIEFQSAGFSSQPQGEIQFQAALDYYRTRKVSSVVLTAVASNYFSGGRIQFSLLADGKTSVEVDEHLPEYTSRQYSYRLSL